ncbi:hypothetical protein BH20ACT15_BH20ACT15_13660 [soil metagenome]
MASSWKQNGLIEAPVEQVWSLISDPSRFPEWSPASIAVTGVPTKIEEGASFEIKSRGPLGLKPTTTFEVTELDEMRTIKLRCQTSGYYSRWVLTAARGATFAEVELGMEPFDTGSRIVGLAQTKGHLRRIAEGSLDGLCTVLDRGPTRK